MSGLKKRKDGRGRLHSFRNKEKRRPTATGKPRGQHKETRGPTIEHRIPGGVEVGVVVMEVGVVVVMEVGVVAVVEHRSPSAGPPHQAQSNLHHTPQKLHAPPLTHHPGRPCRAERVSTLIPRLIHLVLRQNSMRSGKKWGGGRGGEELRNIHHFGYNQARHRV
ncbi:hypothetical protein Pmani_038977 [Petrolisthes manimaculis]|uniref:Uncharacterized protein n=1 Tax=Petrolisthes manimaculis TaxID=1843537 RepID=A0AAE1NF14_9EUCA|nr:hypothetical protein Pmani_038977 [Petrolisthes manimaculis]